MKFQLAISYLEDWPIHYRNGNLYLLFYKFKNPENDPDIEKYNDAIEDKVKKMTYRIIVNFSQLGEYNTLTLYVSDATVSIYGTRFKTHPTKVFNSSIKTSRIIKLYSGGQRANTQRLTSLYTAWRNQSSVTNYKDYVTYYHITILLKIIKKFYLYVEIIKCNNIKGKEDNYKHVYNYIKDDYKVGEIYLDYMNHLDSSGFFMREFYKHSLGYLLSIGKLSNGERLIKPELQRLIYEFFDNKKLEVSTMEELSDKLARRL